MRARAIGTLTAGVWVGIPIGGLLGGYLIAAIGLRPTLLAIGACYVLTTLSLLVNPASRELDRLASSVGDLFALKPHVQSLRLKPEGRIFSG